MIAQKLCTADQCGASRAVVQGRGGDAGAQEALLRRTDQHPVAGGDKFLRLFRGKPQVDGHPVHGLHLVLAALGQMRGHAADDAGQRFLAKHGDRAAREDPAVRAAAAVDAQKAVRFDTGYDQAHLIQVGVQENLLLGGLVSYAADDISHAVDLGFAAVGKLPCGAPGRFGFVARRAGRCAERKEQFL